MIGSRHLEVGRLGETDRIGPGIVSLGSLDDSLSELGQLDLTALT